MSHHRKYSRGLLHTTALFAALCMHVPGAWAEPTGGTVTSGSAAISNSGTTTTINQSTNRAIVRWDTFDLNANEQVKFVQPNAGSITVNRIRDTKPSAINGKISANGNIILINPNGLVFGSSAVVDVGGLVATSSDLDDDNAFMNGGAVKFTKPGRADAKIVNNGQMTVREGGLIGLVAPHVENNGIIQARLGKVQLASGDIHTIDFAGDGLIKLEISDDVYSQSVTNTGTIIADGGDILLTAAAARGIVDTLITNTGTLRANTVTLPDGTKKTGNVTISTHGLSLVEDHAVTPVIPTQIINTGLISANGDALNEVGGHITILADRIMIGDGSVVTATGDSGGGDIRIGGDYQGGGGLPTSDMIYVSDQAILNASSRRRGNGGRIILWSDDNTRFYGDAQATGGIDGGDGGLIEISSHGYLDFNGAVDLHGAHNGTLLLDPTDITISTGLDANINGASPFAPNADDVTSVLNVTTLQAALASGNVIVQTRATGSQLGNITVDNAVTWTSGNTLTLDAINAITVNAAITANNGSLTMIAGADVAFNANISGTGTLTIQQSNDALTMGVAGGAGVLNLSTADLSKIVDGWGNIVLGRATSTVATTVNAKTWTDNVTFLSGTGGVTVAGTQTMAGNTLSITTTGGAVSLGGMAGTTGGLTVNSGGGNISIGTAIVTGGAVSLTSGGGTISNSAAIGSGALTLSSGGGNITLGAGVTAAGTASINSGAGALNINAALNSGANALTLTSNGSAITTNASGTIGAGALTIGTAGGNLVTAAAITATGVTAINTGAGSISLGAAIGSGTNSLSLTTTAKTITTAAITSGALSINSNGANISTGTITATGTTSLASGAGTISIGAANTGANALNLTSSGFGITTAAITSGALTLSSGGAAITTNGIVAASGTTNVDSGGAAINFNAAFGSGTGTLTIATGGGAFTTLTGALSSGAFNITTSGGNVVIGGNVAASGAGSIITGAGSVSVTGAMNTGAANSLGITTTGKTITTAAITSGALTLASNGAAISTGAVTAGGITDINAGNGTISVGAIGAGSNAVSLTTTGFDITNAAITAGALTIATGGGIYNSNGVVSASGTTSVSTGGGAMNINNAFGSGTGTLALATGGGALTKNNTGAITSGALTVTTAGGNISIGTGGVTAAGNSTLNSGAGAISIGGTISTIANSLGITSVNNTITLSAVTAGILNLTSGGGIITTSGTVNQSGTASIDSGGAAININGGFGSSTSATTFLTGGGAFTKGNTGVLSSAALTITTAGGNISIGTGGVTAAGTTTMTTGAGSVAVGGTLNTGSNALNITTTANTITLATVTAGAMTLASNDANISLGALTYSGTSSISSGNGTIAITGAVTTGNAAALGLTTTGYDITTNAITAGALTIATGGGIYNSNGVVAASGTTSVNTGGGAMNINNAFGSGTGTLALTTGGGALIKNNTGAITSGALTITTAGGGLTIGTGGVTATGNSTLNSGAGAISIGGTISTGANSLGITAVNNTITLASVTAGALTIGSGGGIITTSGTVNQSGTASINSAGAAININGAFGSSTSATTFLTGGGLFTKGNTGALNSAALTITTSGGNISIGTGGVTAAGITAMTTGAGSVAIASALSTGANALNITTTANTITLGAVTSGAMTLASNNANISVGALTYSGTSSINSGNGTIAITGAVTTGNTSALSLTTTGYDITHVAITSGALTIATGGGIYTSNGVVAASGTTSVNTGGSAMNINNAFGSGTGTLALTTGGGALTKANTGAITSAALTIGTSGGNVSIGTGGVTTTGTATITAGAGTVAIGGTLSTGTNALNITTTAKTITLGTVTAGAATLNSNNANISVGALTYSGTSSISSGNGTIVITGTATTSNTSGLTLTSTGFDITTGAITSTTGALSVNTGGGIYTSGGIVSAAVTGVNTGGGNLKINNAFSSNASTMTLTTGGGTLTKAATGTLTSGALNITTTGGGISIASAVATTGTATLNSGAGATSITGAVSAGTNAFNITTTANTISLAAIAAGGSTFNSNGGGITLGGTTTVSGTWALNSGAGNIGVTGAVTASGANTLTMTTTGGNISTSGLITMGTGALTMTTAGTGTITIGAAGITATTSTNAVLTSASGVIAVNGVINTKTGNLTITTDGNLGLGIANALTGTGTLTIQQATNSKVIGIGAGQTGDILIDAIEYPMIKDGWAGIVIGSTTGTGGINVGTTTWTDSLTLRSSTGAIALNGAQTFGANNFTITTDGAVSAAATISGGAGTFTIQPLTATTAIALGDTQTGALAISSASMAFLTSNWTNVVVGNTTMTGAINVGTATWADAMKFITSTGAINFNGLQTMSGNHLNATTNTGVITFNANVAGTNNLTISTNADIVLNANIAGTGTLTISGAAAGTTMGIGDSQTGTINFTNAELGKITFGWTNIIFGQTGATGAMNVGAWSWDDGLALNSGTGIIHINGATTMLNSNSLTITTSSNLDVAANLTGASGATLTISTSAGGTGFGIGNGQSGTVGLTDTELNFIQDGWGNLIFGATGTTAAMNIGAYTWKDNVTFRSGTGLMTIAGATTGANNLTLSTDSNLVINGNLTGTGTLTIRAMNNTSMAVGDGQTGTIQITEAKLARIVSGWAGVVFGHTGLTTGTINIAAHSWNSSATFITGAAVISVNGAQTMGANNLTFTTDGDLAINAGLGGEGNLTFQVATPATSTNTIGIGTGQSGTVMFSNTELGNILNGWNSIVFGSAAQTGAMNIGAYTWQYDTTFRTGAGIINILGDQSARNLTYETNANINIAANLTGTGTLTIRQAAASSAVTMSIGAVGGTIAVDSTELGKITNGWNKLVFGRADTAAGGTMTVSAYSNWQDNVQFITGAGPMTIGGAQNFNGNNLTLSANSDITVSNALTSAGGNLVVEGAVPGTVISIAGTGGTLNLTAAELNQITDGWNSLTFGNVLGTAAMTIAAYTWKDDATFVTNGNVTVSGLQTATTGTNLVYATLAGAFKNTTGSTTPITAGTGGRYLIYSVSSGSDVLNGFTPPSPLLQKSYFNYSPSQVVETGNHILYSSGAAKILYLQIDDKSKIYGDALPTFTYTYLGGLQGGDTISAALTSATLSATGASTADYVGTLTAITGIFATALGYTTQVTDGTLSVTKAPVLVTPADTSQAYGDSYPTVAVNYIGLRNGENSSVIDTLASTTAGTDNTSNVGTYTITASGALDNNYTFNYTTGTLTINKAVVTVTTQDATREYGLNNPALSVVYDGLKNGQTQSVFSTLATASTTATAASDVDDYIITSTGAAASNYSFVYADTGTLSVTKATLTATTQNATREYGIGNTGLLNVVYTGFRNSQNDSVIDTKATVSTGATILSDVGTYDITSTGAFDNNYTFSYADTGKLSITKATLTATTQNATREYGLDNTGLLTVVYTGFRNSDDEDDIDTKVSIGTTATAASDVASYLISATGGLDTNYTFAYANTGLLSVTKAMLTATTQDATREYGLGNTGLLNVVYTGFRNTDTDSVINTKATATTTATALSDVGSYGISSTGAMDNNYDFTYVDSGQLSVTKAMLTATTQNATREYGLGNTGLLNVVYTGFRNTDTDSVINTKATATTAATALSDVGSYLISSSGAMDNNYDFTYVDSGHLSVTKATLTATTQDATREYGLGNTGLLTVVYTGFRNSDDENNIDTKVSIGTTATAASDVASYLISATGGLDTNYTFAYANTGLLSVTKAMLTATTQDATRQYGLGNTGLLNVVYTGFRNSDDETDIGTKATATTTATALSDVGSYGISSTGAMDNNYDFTYVDSGHLAVTKATLTATTQNATREYGLDNTGLLNVVYTGFRNSDDETDIGTKATAATGATIHSNVGSYDITATGASSTNYDFVYADTGKLSITKATLTATTQDATREYGLDNTGLLNVVYTGFRNSDDESDIDTKVSVATTATAASDVASYLVTATGGLDGNYTFAYANTGHLSVTKAMLTATTQNATRQYGAAEPTFHVVYTGFRNTQNDSVIDTKATATTDADAGSDVGTYGISSTGAMDGNYDFTYVDSGILSVTKATLTATTQNATREYGLDNTGLLNVVYTGFRNSDNETDIDTKATVSTGATSTSNVGNYDIIAADALDTNYNFVYANTGDLSITKATLTATTQDATREYGLANPVFTVVYTGFRNNEDQSVINTLAHTASASIGSDVGTYGISASAASDNNYNFVYSNAGLLSVTKATANIRANNQTRDVADLGPFALTVTYTGLRAGDTAANVAPTLTTSAVAGVSPVGHYTIAVTGAMDGNYNFTYTNGVLSLADFTALPPVTAPVIPVIPSTADHSLTTPPTYIYMPQFASSSVQMPHYFDSPSIVYLPDNDLFLTGSSDDYLIAISERLRKEYDLLQHPDN